MKAYKGFDRNMQCRGFQFREGGTYETPKAELCQSGFHACTMPIDVFQYYEPFRGCLYHEVELEELDEDTDKCGDDSKICGRKITISRKMTLEDMITAQVAAVLAEAKGAAQASGNRGAAQASGDQGVAQASGYWGMAQASGNRGAAQASGDRGAAQASGDQGVAQASGKHGVATAAGSDCRVSGALGCALFAVERAEDGRIISVAAGIVDGDALKPGIWYRCKGGKLVEVWR